MGSDGGLFDSPNERRADRLSRQRAMVAEHRERRVLQQRWYEHYRKLGLGHWRADEHARKRVLRGKLPS